MIERRNIGQTQPDKIWERQWARFRDMTERIPTDVVVLSSVRKSANSNTVEHNPDDSFECRHSNASLKVYRLALVRQAWNAHATV
jgi:hypothetical protein